MTIPTGQARKRFRDRLFRLMGEIRRRRLAGRPYQHLVDEAAGLQGVLAGREPLPSPTPQRPTDLAVLIEEADGGCVGDPALRGPMPTGDVREYLRDRLIRVSVQLHDRAAAGRPYRRLAGELVRLKEMLLGCRPIPPAMKAKARRRRREG
jgi:hypothetical protein